MLLRDILSETTIALTANKARSGLTVLGIVIGIASVIAMIAIGQGTQQSVEQRIASIGSNLLMIRPGANRPPGESVRQSQGSAQSLTLDDVDAIKRSVPSIAAMAPSVSTNQQVVANGQNARTSITGTVSAYQAVRNITIAKGHFITKEQEMRRAKVAILGPDVVQTLFGSADADCLGRSVRINGIPFTVIGTTESRGVSGFGSDDDVIYIPLDVALHYLTGTESLSLVSISVAQDADMRTVSDAITGLLRTRHRIADGTEDDFRVMNQADLVETATSVTETFTLLLGAIASISLVVGGIGIMNMMLTTVTERTREIGLRKAIGAKRAEITVQFLSEAIVLTLIGGIIGVGVGYAVGQIFAYFTSAVATTSLTAIFLACGVSAGIGIIFGFYPARRAARLNPIEALRYE